MNFKEIILALKKTSKSNVLLQTPSKIEAARSPTFDYWTHMKFQTVQKLNILKRENLSEYDMLKF